MARTVMLTTEDNPYDPKTEWDDWYNFDVSNGYNTCAYLSRIARTSENLGEELNDHSVEQAIDEIISFNLSGNYKKLVYED